MAYIRLGDSPSDTVISMGDLRPTLVNGVSAEDTHWLRDGCFTNWAQFHFWESVVLDFADVSLSPTYIYTYTHTHPRGLKLR